MVLDVIRIPEKLEQPEQAAARRRGSRRARPVTLVPVLAATIAAVVALLVAAVVAALPAPRPVTADPPPAGTMATARIFNPGGLISDPFVLPTPTLDYLYSSGIGGAGQPHLPEHTFAVMGRFLSAGDAVPALPSWVEPGTGLWAPDVRKVGRIYVMWFSGLYRGYVLPTGVPAQCVGVATSRSPTGPFVAGAPAPTVCQTSEYGDIDPRTFVAPDGREWLYWKNDGNAVSAHPLTTHIYARRLAANGRTPVGPTTVLLANDLPWEGPLVEAPDMVRDGRRYLLFFAGNSSDAEVNGVGLALCRGPGGPCTSPYAGPWLGSNAQGAGPGEETVYAQNGVTWMLYTPHALYYPDAVPGLAAARIAFTTRGMPYVASHQGMVPGVSAGRGGQVGAR
ncbi:MAG: family 43 glycosylhydrolase [Acidimicrobiales bacterium]